MQSKLQPRRWHHWSENCCRPLYCPSNSTAPQYSIAEDHCTSFAARRRVACQWRKTNWKKQKKTSQEPSPVGQMEGMADGMAPPSCQTQPVQHSTAHGRRVQHGQDSSAVCTALSPPHMHAPQRQILAVLGGVIDESVCLVAYCVSGSSASKAGVRQPGSLQRSCHCSRNAVDDTTFETILSLLVCLSVCLCLPM